MWVDNEDFRDGTWYFQLHWDAVDGADSYKVEANDDGQAILFNVFTDTECWIDSGGWNIGHEEEDSDNDAYYFFNVNVIAVNQAGESDKRNVVHTSYRYKEWYNPYRD